MTRPLRILFITDAFPPHAYGSGWSAYHLARGLRAQGHTVRVILAHAALRLEATTYDDFPVWRARPTERTYNPAVFAISGLGPGRIARSLVRRWRPDVIHAQHINSALIAHHVAGSTPVIITVRDHWPICFYGTALADARCPACLHGTRSVCNARRGSPDATRVAHRLKATTMRAMLAQRGRALRAAMGVIAASEAIEREVRTVVGPDSVIRIPNAVDQGAVATADASVIPNIPERFFLFAGKLSAHKGADLLPAIMRSLGDDAPPLLVVGDGEEAAALHAAANDGGLPIRVLGRVPNTAAIGLMRRAIALVTPARWPEPLSRTHLEALAAGCPIVATDTGGTGEIVVDGVTGYLTAVGDTDAMAHALSILASDVAMRDKMSVASRDRSTALFSLDAVTNRHIAVYEAAITRKHRGGGL
jgi:glycosyltransferase involved in cell wall biosynthesis